MPHEESVPPLGHLPSGALTGHACARSRTADIRVRHPAALKTVHARQAIVQSEAPTPFD